MTARRLCRLKSNSHNNSQHHHSHILLVDLLPLSLHIRALQPTLHTNQAIRHLQCLLPTLDVYLASSHRTMPNIRAHRYNSTIGSSSLHKRCLPSPHRSRLHHQTSWTSR